MANLTVPTVEPVSNHDNSRYPAVVAIIPALNEEALVQKSLRSLLEQKSISLVEVLLVADNCTDSTVEVANSLRDEFPVLRVIESQENRAGKSGAMNQGLKFLLNTNADYILQMDADTILNEHALIRAIEQLEPDSSLGGVCARFRILPVEVGGFTEKLLWKFQNLEYGLRDVATIQSFGKDVSLLSGRASVFRYETLTELLEDRGYVWDENCEVEDHELTLALKKKGWETAVGMKMLAVTSVPTSIEGWLKQRTRWYIGTVKLIKKERFSKHTRKDSFTLLSLLFWLPLRISFQAWIIMLLAGIGEYQFNLVFTVLAAVLWFFQLVKLQYVPDRDKWQTLLVATIVPYELYATIRDLVLFVSSILGLMPSRRDKRTFIKSFYTFDKEDRTIIK